MSWKDSPRAAAKLNIPTPDPSSIVHEIDYRGYRIVQTTDRKCVGSHHPDKHGFFIQSGFVVLDEFDDVVLPVGAHWHYSPDDAMLAIEMRDTILPSIKEDQPATTFLYEYGRMRQYRRQFWLTYQTLVDIQKVLDEAKTWGDFEGNPYLEQVQDKLHLLRQNVAREVTARGPRMPGEST